MAKKSQAGGEIITERQARLIEAGAEIAAGDPEAAYVPSVLCQVYLPRRRIDAREYHRDFASHWISVQAGNASEAGRRVPQPIPYGPLPRLIISYITTAAVQQGMREIPLGRSPAEFLRFLGLDRQGARYATLRRQTAALAAARIQIGYGSRTTNLNFASSFYIWENDHEDEPQQRLWRPYLELTEDYYDHVREHGVPLDTRALMALKGSALALDAYSWLAYRLHRLGPRGAAITWPALQTQFGAEYASLKDFRREFRAALKSAVAVYPQAGGAVDLIEGGLRLTAARPPIAYRAGG